MSTTTLTSKGQVTLPKAVRDRLGLKPGDKLSCRVAGEDEIVIRRKERDVKDLVGLLKAPGRRKTTDDMRRAVEEGAVARVRRGLRRS